MEETRKSPNSNGGNRKMVVKASGGGIGAVVLLGGALATAALVSAFAVRRKRRSSGDDSSPEIHEKSEDIIREGGEKIELENYSAVMSSDQSSKSDDKGKIETEGGFDIVNDGISLLAENFKIELVKDVTDDGDGAINATSNEEVTEKKENSREWDQEDNGVEEYQTKEFEGFRIGDGEINEDKCVDKTILPLFESPPVQQEDIPEEEKENGIVAHPLLGDCLPVIGELDEANIQVPKASLHLDGKKKEIENDEVSGGIESNWESHWQVESIQQVKLMKYEVGGKIEEDILHENMLIKKDGWMDSSMLRVMIWMICVVSSLSCSWFFDLSFVQLGLFVFLTVFLLEIYGFSMLNRQHDYVMNMEHKRGNSELGNI